MQPLFACKGAQEKRVCAAPLQANATAVQSAARSTPNEVLSLQVLQLRACMDAMLTATVAASSKDALERLKAKQQLRGRSRQAAGAIGPLVA